MFEKKTHLYLTHEERLLVLHSLVEWKNDLMKQGRYTDCIDELIIKFSNAKIKNVTVTI